jgi:hypothetical protein
MIVYPVKGINEDDEDLDGMIVDATGRALEVHEIVEALNAPRVPDAPPGYRHELVRIATQDDPSPH